MEASFATLGINIDSSRLVATRGEFEKLAAAGEAAAARAQRAWAGVGNVFQRGGFASGFLAQQQIMRQMIRDQELIAQVAPRTGHALQTVERGLSALAFQAAGVSGAAGRVATGLLSFGGSSTLVLGAVAGIGAIALAYEALTRDARAATAAITELIAAQLRQRQDERSRDIRGREALGTLQDVVAERRRAFDLARARALEERQREARGTMRGEAPANVAAALRAETQAQTQLNDALMAYNRQLRELKGIETAAARETRLKREDEAIKELVRDFEQLTLEVTRLGATLNLAAIPSFLDAELIQGFKAQKLGKFDVDKGVDNIAASVKAELAKLGDAKAQADVLRMGEMTGRLFVQGIRSGFEGVADQLLDMWGDLGAKLLDEKVFQKLGKDLGEQVKIGLAGAGLGFGIGAQTANPLFGAGSGALGAAALGGGPFAIAGAGLAGLVGGLLGLSQAAEEARRRLREFERSMEGFRASLTPSALDDELLSLRARFDEMRQTVLALNHAGVISGGEAHVRLNELETLEAKRVAQLQAEAAALKQAQQEDLIVRGLRAHGLDQEADDMAFALAQQRELAEARRNEADEAYLQLLATVQLAEAHKRAADRIRDTIGGLTATIDTLQAFSNGLRLTAGLTTLSPMQQLAEARRQYEAVLGRAQRGDQTAAGQLPEIARVFLEASRAVNASGGRYQVDFFRVLRETEELQRMYGDQRDDAQQQLDELTRISIELGDANTQLEPIQIAAQNTVAELKSANKELGRVTAVLLAGFTELQADNEEARSMLQKIALRLEGARL